MSEIGEIQIENFAGFRNDEVTAGATGHAAENEDVSDVVEFGVISNSVAEADADGFVETASTIVAMGHERLDLDEPLGKFHFWRERKAGQRGEAGAGLLGEKLHATADVTRPFVDRAVFAEVSRGESEFVQPWTDRAGGIDVTGGHARSERDAEHAVFLHGHGSGEGGHFAIVDDLERDAAPGVLQVKKDAADTLFEVAGGNAAEEGSHPHLVVDVDAGGAAADGVDPWEMSGRSLQGIHDAIVMVLWITLKVRIPRNFFAKNNLTINDGRAFPV